MTTVTVSPKFQVVIPKAIREALNIVPGQKVQMIRYQGRIELIPLIPIEDAYGFLEGFDTTVDRDDDRL